MHGLDPHFAAGPSPTLGHGADDRLAAGLHGHMLDPDHLLALAAVAVEGVGQRREGAHQLVAVLQPHLPTGEGLLGSGRPGGSTPWPPRGSPPSAPASMASTTSRAPMSETRRQGRPVTDLLGVRIFLAAAPDRAEHLVGGVAGDIAALAAAQLELGRPVLLDGRRERLLGGRLLAHGVEGAAGAPPRPVEPRGSAAEGKHRLHVRRASQGS